jgi:undecaprenyl-diphosphatase
MDIDIINAIILGIVEGLTEFLPVSSTGHLIIANKLLGITNPVNKTGFNFWDLFTVCIQPGGILAIVVLYWKKFLNFSRWRFYLKILAGVIPFLIIGFLLKDYVDKMFDKPLAIGVVLVLGGILFLFIDKWFNQPKVMLEEEITNKKAFFIGLWQILALMPGVSRAAAATIGGMQQGLNRQVAAEFSFFLAVPTLCAAAAYKFLKHSNDITNQQWQLLGIGNVVAFIVALLAVKLFVNFLKMFGFKLFGYYRIIAGLFIIIYFWG